MSAAPITQIVEALEAAGYEVLVQDTVEGQAPNIFLEPWDLLDSEGKNFAAIPVLEGFDVQYRAIRVFSPHVIIVGVISSEDAKQQEEAIVRLVEKMAKEKKAAAKAKPQPKLAPPIEKGSSGGPRGSAPAKEEPQGEK